MRAHDDDHFRSAMRWLSRARRLDDVPPADKFTHRKEGETNPAFVKRRLDEIRRSEANGCYAMFSIEDIFADVPAAHDAEQAVLYRILTTRYWGAEPDRPVWKIGCVIFVEMPAGVTVEDFAAYLSFIDNPAAYTPACVEL